MESYYFSILCGAIHAIRDNYTWQTYAQSDVRRHAVGSAIQALFRNRILTGEDGFETVGIWALNRSGASSFSLCQFFRYIFGFLEWQIVNLATQIYGKALALVSLYNTLGPDSTGEFRLNVTPLIRYISIIIQNICTSFFNCATSSHPDRYKSESIIAICQ
jgi:hypothetical protein